MNRFDTLLDWAGYSALYAEEISTMQVNLGPRCNQLCPHCHQSAGPDRTEMMSAATIDLILDVLDDCPIVSLDITGGAPELHPDFRRLVRRARAMGVHVIDRCNLTVLRLSSQWETARFLRDHQVEITASLPCYTEEGTDAARGPGVFGDSIAALKLLNDLGYGYSSPELVLNLVYNPSTAALPPDARDLEADFKRELMHSYGIRVDRVLTMTNSPIGRFDEGLGRSGDRDRYIRDLADAFNPETLPRLMCRRMISVGWDGRLYDCDFNLALSLHAADGATDGLYEFDYEALSNRRIVTGEHCLACAAGSGSSCGGALISRNTVKERN
jgi:radical SAM/Cys-rich protein